MRNGLRAALILAMLVIWMLAPALVSAAGLCATMSGPCEGPCGAASCTPRVMPSVVALTMVELLPVRPSDGFSSATLRLPEVPPRSLFVSL